MKRVAINGFGRIGRLVLRALWRDEEVQIVAINDLAPSSTLAHLLEFDSAHGRWEEEVKSVGEALVIGEKRIPVFSEKDPTQLPWGELEVDLVLECSGVFRTRQGMEGHLRAGAQKVLLSAPAKDEGILTLVEGVNDHLLTKEEKLMSNASCTTNCLAPVAKVLHQEFGIKRGFMTTVHAYTGDQNLQDGPHRDLRRARAAAASIIPTSTGATQALGKVMPELAGKLTGMAMRVPVITGSSIDLNVILERPADRESVNRVLEEASRTFLRGILSYSERPLVSSDIIGDPHAAIVNGDLTEVLDDMVKVVAWYDNEAGYASRLASMAKKICAL